MAITKTTINQIPWPDKNEKLNNNWAALRDLAQAVDGMVGSYASTADLAAKNTAPSDGDIAVITGTKQVLARMSGAWVQIYPQTPTIRSGSGAPAASLGSAGDVYLQY